MRIVAGRYGGRYLRVPRGNHVRPTTDRVKESLFAILRHDLPGAKVLDLFAGCGNLGIEALSRGAEHTTFVDSYPLCIEIIRANLKALRVDRTQTRLIRGDAVYVLTTFQENEEQFDIAFLDPPYDSNLVNETLRVLGMSRLVAPEGVVVVEHPQKSPPADFYGSLTRVRVQDYGYSVISFYRHVTQTGESDG